MENLEDILGAMDVLLTMNQEQQQAVSEAIQELKRQNKRLETSGDNLQKDVKAAIGESMRDSADTAKWAMNEAITPLLDRLTRDIEKATNRATDEKKQLNRAYALLGWKWLGLASLASISVTALLVFGVYSAVWWQRHELESMRADAAEMEQNIARLEKLNGRIHLETCGNRACIEVDTKHAYGDADSRYKFFWLRSR